MHAPTGTVYLGHVPWDSSYKHVYEKGFGNPSAVIGNFMTMETNNYVFIRQDSNIRVPYNADDLYGINYCVYRNSGKTFCCFVNTITYVSNNTTLLHLEEDIWQTWGGSLSIAPCMVAREHVSGDGLGQNRAPEPAMELESVIIRSTDTLPELVGSSIVVGVNAIPHLKNGGSVFAPHVESDFDGSDAVAGSIYSGLYSGCHYYGFSFADADLTNFLNNLNMCGAAESVACMFMVPANMIAIGSGHEISGYVGVQDGGFTAPQTLGSGYTPRNKKCLTYPYAYCKITDNDGGSMDLKYEDCNNWGAVDYKLVQGLDPTAAVYYVPRNHMGQAIDYSHMMPIAQNAQCSWVYSAYQNWLAQNAETLASKKQYGNIGMVSGLAIAAVGAGLLATGIGAPAGAGMIGSLGISSLTAAGLGVTVSGASTAIGSAHELNLLESSIDAQSKIPNTMAGSSSNNSLQAVGACGGYSCVALELHSAQRLDMFFDVFGYQVDMVKVPNITGRPNWNYVKTIGANAHGNVPADKLAAMNKCLDNGITFWHTEDVGNYGLNNQIS